MTYQKEDVKYITTTFLVLFILAILNISIPIGNGLFSSISVGLIGGIIFAMYRFRKYLSSKNMKLLYASMIFAIICSFIPLILGENSVFKEIQPQINFILQTIIKPEILADEFLSLVKTVTLIQGNLVNYIIILTMCFVVPLLAMLISSALFLFEVADSRQLEIGKKLRKSFILSGLFIALTTIFSVMSVNIILSLISNLTWDGAQKIVAINQELHQRLVMMQSSGAALTSIFGILFIVFFIRSLVMLNTLNKQNEASHFENYHSK